MSETTYRICPRSGMQFDTKAEKLMRWNAVAGVLALLVGGIMALGVILTRWPSVKLLDAETFYLVLTAHGVDMLLVWIIFFEMAVLYFTSSTLLRCRLATPGWAWVQFWLMAIGAVIGNVAILSGNSSVMFTSYAPMQASHWFYLGIILFAVGALIGCFVFMGTLVVAQRDKTYEGSIPLVTFGALTGCIIAIFTLLQGAAILVPTWLWSLGVVKEIDALAYRMMWWGLGHSSQQINVAAHVAVWYLIAGVVLGAKPLSEKVSRMAYFMYILFLQLASAHHLLSDPGMSSEWKVLNTSYFMYFAVMASMIHGFTVPGAIEAAQRKKGFTNGMFEWLRKAPWGNPVFSGMFISLVSFGFIGGITGVVLGTEQLNMLMHNTFYVPGHFHATVVSGTTLAFMSLTYLLIPILFKREIAFPKMAQAQPFVFGGSMAVLTVVMMGAGTLGVSRRHWDMAFSGAPFQYEWPGAAYLMMGMTGFFGVLACIGGAMFLIVTVGSLLIGKKLDDGQISATCTPHPKGSVSDRATAHGDAEHVAVPGTVALAMLLLATFVLYYFVNWKYLSEVWGLS
ncbi:MAG: cbb3-type cytochrome c oxidase subunit I [Rhodocyclaceae bacterium]|nr:cbb3-type cytochrome c oxidase subunit I [Rhodocyclaceae bacterium]